MGWWTSKWFISETPPNVSSSCPSAEKLCHTALDFSHLTSNVPVILQNAKMSFFGLQASIYSLSLCMTCLQSADVGAGRATMVSKSRSAL
jgi:hypothetical protein